MALKKPSVVVTAHLKNRLRKWFSLNSYKRSTSLLSLFKYMNKNNKKVYQTSPINFRNTCCYMNKIEKSSVFIEIFSALVNILFQCFPWKWLFCKICPYKSPKNDKYMLNFYKTQGWSYWKLKSPHKVATKCQAVFLKVPLRGL